MRLVEKFPEDYVYYIKLLKIKIFFKKEKFCYFKDSFHLYNEKKHLNLKCFSCGSSKHWIETCPLLHYTPNKLNIIKNYSNSTNENRDDWSRISFKYNARRNIKEVQFNALGFSNSKGVLDSEISEDNDELEFSPRSRKSSFLSINNRMEFGNNLEIKYRPMETIVKRKKLIFYIHI